MKKYLSNHYYNVTMEEYEKKFFKLLRFVGYFKDDNVKIQKKLSGLP